MKTCGVCASMCVFAYARVCAFLCLCTCLHYALFGTFSRRGVCYPCLLESDRRLCLIGVFTLSGLTHTDTLDLGSPPFAMKRENSDTETCLLLCWEEKLCCYLFISLFFCFLSVCLSSGLVVCFGRLQSFLFLKKWTFQPQQRDLRDVREGHKCLLASCCSLIKCIYRITRSHTFPRNETYVHRWGGKHLNVRIG